MCVCINIVFKKNENQRQKGYCPQTSGNHVIGKLVEACLYKIVLNSCVTDSCGTAREGCNRADAPVFAFPSSIYNTRGLLHR